VVFDPAYVYTADVVKKQFDAALCLGQPRCEGKARITFVGRFEGPAETGYGHLNSYHYQFSIVRIEKVEPVAVDDLDK
jgi:hypothetical protein